MMNNMRTALLVIDMQNDFVLPEGVLCVEESMSTVPAIKSLLDFARNEKWFVIHVIRVHDSKGFNVDKTRFCLFENGGMGYCVEGSFGA